MKDIVVTTELIIWINEAIETLKRDKANIEGQIEGLLHVRRAFSDEMEIKND